ncbi:MAG: NAD/FAD-binding protein, partial [Nitratireductor sp.]
MRTSAMDTETEVCVTYWMNELQGIDPACPLFVSLNPVTEPRADMVFGEWSFDHPQFDAAALSAQARLDDIQGRGHCWYAGAW